MKNTTPAPVSTVSLMILCLLCFAPSLPAENTAWNEHSIRIGMGYVDNGGTLPARDTYMPLNLGSASEQAAGFTMVQTRDYDFEIMISKMTSAGVQKNWAGSGNEANYMNFDLTYTRLDLLGKRLFARGDAPFSPWLGCGINIGMVETSETETIGTAGGNIRKPTLEKVSTAMGASASAGIDIYPSKTSALALDIEARYSVVVLTGPYTGDLNGLMVLIGIRWDFWPSTL